MANTAQAKKRARQNETRRQHNTAQRSMMRTYIKKVVAATHTGDKAQAKTAYEEAQSVLDRMASKGLIHKNKASRHKERLSAKIKALA